MILVHAAHTKERHTGDFGLLLQKGNASSAVNALILVHAAHNKVRQIDLGTQTDLQIMFHMKSSKNGWPLAHKLEAQQESLGLMDFEQNVLFYNCIVPLGFLPWEIRAAFPGGKLAATIALPNAQCILAVSELP